MTRDEIETALDRGRLQMQSVGHYSGGKWYDVRRNGATKTWKRNPHKVEIPCKVGFRECFRLEGSVNVDAVTYERNVWKWNYSVRVRPADFDPRKRG
jgi:hypothetical protein